MCGVASVNPESCVWCASVNRSSRGVDVPVCKPEFVCVVCVSM